MAVKVILFFFLLLLPKCCSSTMQVTSKNPKEHGVNRSLFAPFSEGSSAGKAFTPACLIFYDTLVPWSVLYLKISTSKMWQRWRYHKEAKEKPTSVCVCVLQKRKKKWQYPRQMKSVFTSDLFVKSAQMIYGLWLRWEVTMRVQDHRN